MIIGITGGTGSGKTTLLRQIAARGGRVLDCDAIYHQLLQDDHQLLMEIRHQFPEAFSGEMLNRKKLGDIVFSNPSALWALNQMTHSAVKREVECQLSNAPALAAIDAIALFESGLDTLCDVTVAVVAPVEARVHRLVERDGISETYARKRIAAQPDENWFRTKCDHCLVNDGDAETFLIKCAMLLDLLRIPPKVDEKPLAEDINHLTIEK